MIKAGALERVVPLRCYHHHLLLLALNKLLHLEHEVLLGEVTLAWVLNGSDLRYMSQKFRLRPGQTFIEVEAFDLDQLLVELGQTDALRYLQSLIDKFLSNRVLLLIGGLEVRLLWLLDVSKV